MIAGANLVVDAVARAHHALAALELLGSLDAQPALARQHAFAVGDDDFQAAFGRAHRFLQGRDHLGDAVGAHRAQPFDAERAHGLFDADAGPRAAALRRARRQILLTGRRGVTV